MKFLSHSWMSRLHARSVVVSFWLHDFILNWKHVPTLTVSRSTLQIQICLSLVHAMQPLACGISESPVGLFEHITAMRVMLILSNSSPTAKDLALALTILHVGYLTWGQGISFKCTVGLMKIMIMMSLPSLLLLSQYQVDFFLRDTPMAIVMCGIH